jgi:hypothetical protein
VLNTLLLVEAVVVEKAMALALLRLLAVVVLVGILQAQVMQYRLRNILLLLGQRVLDMPQIIRVVHPLSQIFPLVVVVRGQVVVLLGVYPLTMVLLLMEVVVGLMLTIPLVVLATVMVVMVVQRTQVLLIMKLVGVVVLVVMVLMVHLVMAVVMVEQEQPTISWRLALM